MSEVRAFKVEIGMIVDFWVLPIQVIYNKQSDIKLGDLLFLYDYSSKLSHLINMDKPPKEPLLVMQVIEVKYKSRLKKFFRSFLKEPIEYIRCEVNYVKENW